MDLPGKGILFSLQTTHTVADDFDAEGGDYMFKELTGELLDLTATVQGYRNAFLARQIILCCTCTVRWQ